MSASHRTRRVLPAPRPVRGYARAPWHDWCRGAAPGCGALVLGLALYGAASPVPARAAPQTAADAGAFDPLVRGRELTRLFMAGELDSLGGVWNAQMGAMMTPRQLEIFHQQVAEQLGALNVVLDERVTPHDSLQVYTRLAQYSKMPLPVETQWALDPRGKVAAFYVRPAMTPAPTEYLEYQTKTPLRLPFGGRWWVFWGGRVLAENVHVTAPDQRFAADLVIREANSSRRGEGKTNEDFYAFGQTIVAPGPGTVVAALDTVADNTPGVMNRAQPLGNHVILDHGNGEFSFLCHFKQGSVAVKTGQKVKAGDVLGQCGNSGNSSEPHLHYHLQTTPVPSRGAGLPAQFLRYRANGEAVERGEPKQGQAVEALDPLPASTGGEPARKSASKGGR